MAMGDLRYRWRRAVKGVMRRSGFEVRRTNVTGSVGSFAIALIRAKDLNCVIDVGANLGQYASMLREEGYRGPIVSVEPVTASFEALRARSADDAQWSAVQLALGAASGEQSINITGHSTMASFLEPAQEAIARWDFVDAARSNETVRTARLDEVLDELVPGDDARRLYLKIDTQGWDLEVLRGADGVLDDVKVIQTELSFKPLYEGQVGYSEMLRYLDGLGYEIAGFFPIVYDDNWSVIEADCVLVRREPLPT
jgi:FkbM family methyltransferase